MSEFTKPIKFKEGNLDLLESAINNHKNVNWIHQLAVNQKGKGQSMKNHSKFFKPDELFLLPKEMERRSIKLLTQNMFMLPGIPEFGKKLYKTDRLRYF